MDKTIIEAKQKRNVGVFVALGVRIGAGLGSVVVILPAIGASVGPGYGAERAGWFARGAPRFECNPPPRFLVRDTKLSLGYIPELTYFTLS